MTNADMPDEEGFVYVYLPHEFIMDVVGDCGACSEPVKQFELVVRYATLDNEDDLIVAVEHDECFIQLCQYLNAFFDEDVEVIPLGEVV